jgi:hypothetical protein
LPRLLLFSCWLLLCCVVLCVCLGHVSLLRLLLFSCWLCCVVLCCVCVLGSCQLASSCLVLVLFPILAFKLTGIVGPCVLTFADPFPLFLLEIIRSGTATATAITVLFRRRTTTKQSFYTLSIATGHLWPRPLFPRTTIHTSPLPPPPVFRRPLDHRETEPLKKTPKLMNRLMSKNRV